MQVATDVPLFQLKSREDGKHNGGPKAFDPRSAVIHGTMFISRTLAPI